MLVTVLLLFVELYTVALMMAQLALALLFYRSPFCFTPVLLLNVALSLPTLNISAEPCVKRKLQHCITMTGIQQLAWSDHKVAHRAVRVSSTDNITVSITAPDYFLSQK